MASAQLSSTPGAATPHLAAGGAPPTGSASPAPPPPSRERSRRSKKSRKDKDLSLDRKDRKKLEKKARRHLDKRFGELQEQLVSQVSGIVSQLQSSALSQGNALPSGQAPPSGSAQDLAAEASGDESDLDSPADLDASHLVEADPASPGPLPPSHQPVTSPPAEQPVEGSFSPEYQDQWEDASEATGPTEPRGLEQVAGLEGFSLPGLLPAFSLPKRTHGPSDIQQRMWVSARGGEVFHKVPVDKLESTYRVGAGPFQAPPPLPRGIITDRRDTEADESLRAIQQQWGTIGQAVTRGLSRIEEVVRALQDRAASGSISPSDIHELSQDLATEAVRPFSHVLRLSAARFNAYQIKRKDRLHSSLARQDFALAQAVKETPLATQSFFAEDMSGHIKEAQTRKATKDMLRSVQGQGTRRPAPYDRPQSASVPSFRRGASRDHAGQSRGRASFSGRQPFRSGRPGQGQRGRHQGSSRGQARGRGASQE